MSESFSLEIEKISAELRVRPDILLKLITSFSNSLPQKIGNLREAVLQNDTMKMRSLLHELRGTSGNLRLQPLAQAVIVMHEAVKAGQPQDKITEYFQAVFEQTELLAQRIKG